MRRPSLSLCEKLIATLTTATCFLSLLTLQSYLSDTNNHNSSDKKTITALTWVSVSFAAVSVPAFLICSYQRYLASNQTAATNESIPLLVLQPAHYNPKQTAAWLAVTWKKSLLMVLYSRLQTVKPYETCFFWCSDYSFCRPSSKLANNTL